MSPPFHSFSDALSKIIVRIVLNEILILIMNSLQELGDCHRRQQGCED